MYSFLNNSNIPSNRVSHVVIANDDNLSNALSKYKITALKVTECTNIITSVKNHADMLCNHAGKDKIFVEKSQIHLFNSLKKLGFDVQFISKKLSKEYPNDVLLNCAVVGNKIICNKNSIATELKNYYEKNNYTFIDVKQGYTKCSVCVINNNAIITDDIGIAQKSLKEGIDVLLIEKGDIYLKGVNYGFIGGCSGLINKNKLAFWGNVSYHRNYNEIKAFLNKYEVEPVCLTDDKLVDVGGIIPVCEYKK